MNFWSGKKVLVTGGGGFVGSHLVERLLKSHSKVRVVGTSKKPKRLIDVLDKIDYISADLLTFSNCLRAVEDVDIAFHLASVVAGIGFNVSHHADMFRINNLLNYNMLEASRIEGVERYQCTSSTCIYSRESPVPTPETQGFIDDPEPTVFGYGWAKRVAEIQAKLYATDYGMKISIIRPTNIYGPRDNFNIEKSHVIPALISKMYQSDDTVTIWGSGNQTRSFIYVEDAVRAMMEITERYAVADPINIGTEEEVTIRDLANLILKLTGKNLKLIFEKTKPEGQPRKYADITKAKKILNWEPEYNLEEGLRKTIRWYEKTIYREEIR